jgi:hypothetical protein
MSYTSSDITQYLGMEFQGRTADQEKRTWSISIDSKFSTNSPRRQHLNDALVTHAAALTREQIEGPWTELTGKFTDPDCRVEYRGLAIDFLNANGQAPALNLSFVVVFAENEMARRDAIAYNTVKIHYMGIPGMDSGETMPPSK